MVSADAAMAGVRRRLRPRSHATGPSGRACGTHEFRGPAGRLRNGLVGTAVLGGAMSARGGACARVDPRRDRGHRVGAPGRPLLRRPRRRFAGDGPVLRTGQDADGPPSISIKDVYRHPTIARALDRDRRQGPAGRGPRRSEPSVTDQRAAHWVRRVRRAPAHRVRGLRVRRRAVLHRGRRWIADGSGALEIVRALGRPSAPSAFAAFPVSRSARNGCSSAAGAPETIRLWSLAYLRFWIVKTLVRTSPPCCSPARRSTSLYLRAPGRRGRAAAP